MGRNCRRRAARIPFRAMAQFATCVEAPSFLLVTPCSSSQFPSRSRSFGVAATADGGFLFADTGNMVRKVSAAEMITRVAGTGTAGNSGDDGPATGAQLHAPAGVAVIADGGFLFADARNNEVRKVSVG